MDNIRYYKQTPKNQKSNVSFEEIYTKAGYSVIFERLFLESTSPDKIKIRKLDSAEYDKKINDYKSAGGFDTKGIDEAKYRHIRQGLEEKVQVN